MSSIVLCFMILGLLMRKCAVLFSKKHKSKQKFLKLGGKFIKHETEVKYLGVTLDKILSWRSHIDDKINACKAMLLNITNKYRHTHKAKPKLMKWIYTGVIRPKLTYACLTWGNKINTKLLQQKLNSCLLYTSPSPRDRTRSRMPSSA